MNDAESKYKAFLNGDSKFIIKRLNEKMELASSSLNFEKALEYKEMIKDIEITLKNQIIVLNKDYNFDLFNCYQDNNYISITTFFIRSGTLFGREKKIINPLSLKLFKSLISSSNIINLSIS